ncbi:DMT family transporter [Aestuariivirga sp.]|uniref:DMT family transporter n=1 Tax=Aestuariivirga sp. TaxID=2650926 RepID=UPI0039E5F5BD
MALVPPLCFGTGFTIAKPATAHFPPLFMMLMIYGGIAIVLLITHREPLRTRWPHILLISAFSVTIQGALIFPALKGLSSTAANLIVQIQVPFAVLLGWLLMGDRLDARKLLGTILALVGVGIVIGLPEERPALVPVLLTLGGALTWALGQAFAQKFGRDGGIGLLKANAVGGAPQLLLATLLLEHGQIESLRSANIEQWLMLAFVGIIGFYVAYISWFALLRECRMDDVAPFILLMPVVGVCTAFVMLGERISPAQMIGGAVIMLGLAIVSGLGPRRIFAKGQS